MPDPLELAPIIKVTQEEVMTLEKAIGENLKKFRNAYGYTQENVARYIGVSLSSVRRWERGGSIPRVEALSGLSKRYKVDIDKFFAGAPGMEKKK